jgi:hypothetical protein
MNSELPTSTSFQTISTPFKIQMSPSKRNRRLCRSLGSKLLFTPPRSIRTHKVLEKHIIRGKGSVMAKRKEARKKSLSRPSKKIKTVMNLNKHLQERKSFSQLLHELQVQMSKPLPQLLREAQVQMHTDPTSWEVTYKKEQSAKERFAHEQFAKERFAHEQVAKERFAHEQFAKEQGLGKPVLKRLRNPSYIRMVAARRKWEQETDKMWD